MSAARHRGARVLGCALGLALWSTGALAQEARPGATVDRVAVRFYAPETGGSARPRFITERMLAFEARLEAIAEGSANDAGDERFVRAASDRHVVEEMLANLMIERGSEPPDLPSLTLDTRRAIADRVGGESALVALAAREGIGEEELVTLLRRKVRAAYYIDRAIAPILRPSEEELREAFRTSLHPFRAGRFEDVQEPLRRWVVLERLRVAELAFLQASRARVRIVTVSR